MQKVLNTLEEVFNYYAKGELNETARLLDFTRIYMMNAYKLETDYWIKEAYNIIEYVNASITELRYEIKAIRYSEVIEEAFNQAKILMNLAKIQLNIAEQFLDNEQDKEGRKNAIISLHYVELASIF